MTPWALAHPLLEQPAPLWWRWWLAPAAFALALLFFHVSEGTIARAINSDLFSPTRSFLISKPYVLAMSAGIAEYLFEMIVSPRLKTDSAVAAGAFAAGALLVGAGEAVRKSALFTAGRAFTHDLQRVPRVPRVVQSGVYSYLRHPGYFGWLLWAPGTMVLLANPLSTVAFAALAWRFFRARIPAEESMLLQMYGQEYADYRRRVPTRIWGIP
jgi:protein-S-isoprenylcysteine O-methyltransferase